MSRIAVITDTDASLPPRLAANYGIRQVPILVQFGQETLRTGVDISDADLFARVDTEGRLPTTAAPAPGQFLEAFCSAFEEGADSIVCLCVSGEVESGVISPDSLDPQKFFAGMAERVVPFEFGEEIINLAETVT